MRIAEVIVRQTVAKTAELRDDTAVQSCKHPHTANAAPVTSGINSGINSRINESFDVSHAIDAIVAELQDMTVQIRHMRKQHSIEQVASARKRFQQLRKTAQALGATPQQTGVLLDLNAVDARLLRQLKTTGKLG